MIRKIVLENLRPFSINSLYINTNYGRSKSQLGSEWTYQVFWRLNVEDHLQSLKDLREYFNPKLHKFELSFIAEYDKKEFYTKIGHISARTIDTTNWEKPLADLLFLPKYFESQECLNLNVDDKFVTKCISEKKPSEDGSNRIIIEITIKEI